MVAAVSNPSGAPRATPTPPPAEKTPAPRAAPTPRGDVTPAASPGSTPGATPTARTAADARAINNANPTTLQTRANLEGRVAPSLDQAANGQGALMRGQQGASVRELQTELNASNGNQDLAVDGKFGPKTEAAVRDFQTRNGIKSDGVVGPETVSALRSPTAEQFKTDARYQRLNDATKADIDTRLGAAKNDPAARQNIADLAKRDGFAQLSPAHQKQMLDAQGRAPTDRALTQDLGALADNKAFRGLGDTAKTATLEQLAKHPNDPAARRTISDLATSPGFAGLPDADKTKLMQLVGGNNAYLSGRARPEMERLLRDPAYANATPAEQTAKLQKYLTDQPGLVGVTNGLGHDFSGQRQPYTVGTPTEVKGYDFPSGKADAQRYDVTIDGRTIPVYLPKTPNPASGNLHSVEDIARGLAALPKANRDLIQSVRLDPNQNPADSYWAKQYNDPNFRSYMTAGADGNVSVYPSAGTPPGQSVIDASLIHETGHTLSRQKFGDDSDPRWKTWTDAMAADRVSASAYAKNSQGEDFSETLALYQMVRGTPQEAEIRALMPERFRVLDGMVK